MAYLSFLLRPKEENTCLPIWESSNLILETQTLPWFKCLCYTYLLTTKYLIFLKSNKNRWKQESKAVSVIMFGLFSNFNNNNNNNTCVHGRVAVFNTSKNSHILLADSWMFSHLSMHNVCIAYKIEFEMKCKE